MSSPRARAAHLHRTWGTLGIWELFVVGATSRFHGIRISFFEIWWEKAQLVLVPWALGEPHSEQHPPLQIEAGLDLNAEFMEFFGTCCGHLGMNVLPPLPKKASCKSSFIWKSISQD